jgi:predicted dehydrogenase
MKKTLNAAVIGLGIGERHIRSYESDPRCKVVTICDIDYIKLKEVGSRFPECSLSTNPAEVIADPNIDVVSIASYDNAHAEQAIAAINAGKHVFVEKPICLTESELLQINEALKRNPGIQASSNLVLRRSPQFQLIKSRIVNGEMGRLYHIEGDYNYGRLNKITDGWRSQIPFYSVTHGGAIHLIDLILWLSEGTVKDVVAIGNKISTEGTSFKYPDMVTALLKFTDSSTAKVSANFGSVAPHHHMLSVYGTKASFIHNHQGGTYYNSRNPEDKPELINLKFDNILKGGVQKAFVSQILDGSLGEVKYSEIINAMAVSLAIERSLQSGKSEIVRYPNINNKP